MIKRNYFSVSHIPLLILKIIEKIFFSIDGNKKDFFYFWENVIKGQKHPFQKHPKILVLLIKDTRFFFYINF